MAVHRILQQEIQTLCDISIHHGKTQIWNRGGESSLRATDQGSTNRRPECGEETHSWLHSSRESSCWDRQLGMRGSSQHNCPSRIPHVIDVQTTWLLLLFCGATRANYWIRTVSPRFSGGFERAWRSSDAMFGEDFARGPFHIASVREPSCHIACQSGRAGHPERWASWADCLAMVKARHPIVAARIIGEICRFTPVAWLEDVQALGAVGIELPSWSGG